MQIRAEEPSDFPGITAVNCAAFPTEEESKLVVALRERPEFVSELSLVAVSYQGVVGHILLFPLPIVSDGERHLTLALAPMCVEPGLQGQGIGTELVRHSLRRGADLGYGSVVVLGHPTYYPRFGFRPASEFGVVAPFDAPSEAFMALELSENSLSKVSGVLEYPPEYLP